LPAHRPRRRDPPPHLHQPPRRGAGHHRAPPRARRDRRAAGPRVRATAPIGARRTSRDADEQPGTAPVARNRTACRRRTTAYVAGRGPTARGVGRGRRTSEGVVAGTSTGGTTLVDEATEVPDVRCLGLVQRYAPPVPGAHATWPD